VFNQLADAFFCQPQQGIHVFATKRDAFSLRRAMRATL
jgi:hypothetical protein